jgi:hypothetical protein
MNQDNMEKMDVIVPSKPYQKEPEELLTIGTIVTLKSDLEPEKTRRTISDLIPSEQYPHRYIIENYGFVCELRDFDTIEKP